MIRAKCDQPSGVPLLVVGLTFKDLDMMRKAPGDDHITLRGATMGLPMDIIIFAGRDDRALFKFVEAGIGPDTKLNDGAKKTMN